MTDPTQNFSNPNIPNNGMPFQNQQQFPPPQQHRPPMMQPGVPKAERMTWLIASIIIVIGVFIFGIISFSDGSDAEVVTAMSSVMAGLVLILAHTISVTAIAVAITMFLRMSGRSPGRNAL